MIKLMGTLITLSVIHINYLLTNYSNIIINKVIRFKTAVNGK